MELAERIVGRIPVLAELDRAIDAAQRGSGTMTLLVGEAGIGKTAVLSAVADRATQRSMKTAWGRCWEGPGAPAFWPWVQVVRALGSNGDANLGAARRLLPQSDTNEAGAVEERPGARFELFDGVHRMLEEAAAGRGLLVALDDLQWADEASIALLDFVGRHLGGAPIIVVGTYRDDEASPHLRRVGAAGRIVLLEGLGPDDASALVDAVTGSTLAPSVIDDVTRRSGGNPLFLRELASLVAMRPDDSITDDAIVRLDSVRGVVARRLSRLSDGCRLLLDVSSILGPEFRTDVVSRVLGARDDLADLLAEAIRARVLVPPVDDLGPYRFAHDLFREVVRGDMPPLIRAQLHLAVARDLEEMRDQGAPIPMASLAAHFVAAASAGLRAGVDDAVRCSRAAASESARQLAFEDAVGHLRRAILALGRAQPPQPQVHLEVLLALGRALDDAGDVSAARSAFAEAAGLARERGDAIALAEAAVGSHRLGALSGMARTANIRLLEEAGGGLANQPVALRARVWAGLARELHHSWEPGNLDRARKVAEEAVACAAEIDDPATLAFCLLAQHDAEWAFGSAARRLPIIAEMLDLARAANDRELLAQAHLLEATALLELGDPSALIELEVYCREADGLGHARGRWGAMSRRATSALVAGRLEQAVALGVAASRLGDEIGEPDARGVWDTLRWEIGRFDGSRAGIEPGDHWVPSASWPPHRAVLLAAQGDSGGARAAFDGFLVSHDHEHGIRRHDGWTAAIVAEAATVAGTPEQQTQAYESLRPFAGMHLVFGACMGYGGAVDHYLGTLAVELGQLSEAVAHLEAGVRMHEALGAAAWVSLDRSLLAVLRDESSSSKPSSRPPDRYALIREGDTWTLTFRGRTTRIRHVKGLLDLATLVGQPGREVPCVELMGGADVGDSRGPLLDERARREYQTRVRDLEREIDDARDANDWVRSARAEAELDAFVTQLTQAFGLGGRPRASGSAAERARAAVTHRIRAAIRRVGEVDADAGRHLQNAVRTGTWCVYQPETRVEWDVRTDDVQ